MKIFKSRENIIFALLLLLLVILAVIQININGDKETEVFFGS